MKTTMKLFAAVSLLLSLGACSLLFPEKDATAPTVSLTAPQAGAVSGLVTLSAAASDDTGVFKVVFYVDQVAIGTDTNAPYSCSWNADGAGAGTHALFAKAYDEAGNMGSSATVTVTTSSSGVLAEDFEASKFTVGLDGINWSAPGQPFVATATKAESWVRIEADPLGGKRARIKDRAAAGESVVLGAAFGQDLVKGESSLEIELGSPSDFMITLSKRTVVNGEDSFANGPYLFCSSTTGGGSLVAVDSSFSPHAVGTLATGTRRTIKVAWDCSAGSGSYHVYLDGSLATSGDISFGTAGVDVINFIGITGLPDNGTTYYAADLGVDDLSAKSGTSDVFGGTGGAKLPAPTGVSATKGKYATKVTLDWSEVTGASKYVFYRSDSASGSFTLIGQKTAPAVTADNSLTAPSSYPVTRGAHYFYKVAAVDASSVEGEASAAVEGWANDIPAPAGLAATQGTVPGKVTISWTAVGVATSYNVFRADGSTATPVFIGSTTGTSYDNTTTSPSAAPIVEGTHYWYGVCASDGTGSGLGADVVEGWSKVDPPTAPENLGATKGESSSKVALTWSPVTGATSYGVYRAEAVAGPYVKIGTPTSPAFDDASCLSQKMYAYYVTAINGGGESAASIKTAGYRCDPNYATFEILNQNSSAISQLYISTTTSNWGSNQLPSGVTIAGSSGSRIVWGVPGGYYYVKVVFATGASSQSSSLSFVNGSKRSYTFY